MKDTGDRDLRKLANDYYQGELSYASYRRARTRLLDRITDVTDDADRTRSMAQQVNKPGIAGQSKAHEPERSWYLRGAIWILLVVLIVLILMVWITWSVGQPDPADTAVSGAAAESAGKHSVENDRYLNG